MDNVWKEILKCFIFRIKMKSFALKHYVHYSSLNAGDVVTVIALKMIFLAVNNLLYNVRVRISIWIVRIVFVSV